MINKEYTYKLISLFSSVEEALNYALKMSNITVELL